MAPSHGMLLPPFSLPAINREAQVSLYDYKPRCNLVVCFLPRPLEHGAFLEAIAGAYAEYRESNAEVLVICETADVAADALPFPLLFDRDGEFRRKCLGSDSPAEDHATVLIADRWGEVYGKVKLQPERAQADAEEVRKWAQFVDLQCGECFPPEWPAA